MSLKTFVTPSSKHEKIEQKGETLLISVKEPATGNRANNRVREIIAERFSKPIGKVRILSGHHSRSKMISITD